MKQILSQSKILFHLWIWLTKIQYVYSYSKRVQVSSANVEPANWRKRTLWSSVCNPSFLRAGPQARCMHIFDSLNWRKRASTLRIRLPTKFVITLDNFSYLLPVPKQVNRTCGSCEYLLRPVLMQSSSSFIDENLCWKIENAESSNVLLHRREPLLENQERRIIEPPSS